MFWFTADTHFNHGNIITYCNRRCYLTLEEKAAFDTYLLKPEESLRPKYSQESIERMNTSIFDNINSRVKVNHELWIHGDFCWAKYFGQVKECRNRILCPNVHLILGNHDRFSFREYKEIFSSVSYYSEINIQGIKVVLSHYPLLSWNGADHGGIMLHGHVHFNANIEYIKTTIPNGKRLIDVGVDAVAGRRLLTTGSLTPEDYSPMSFSEILALI